MSRTFAMIEPFNSTLDGKRFVIKLKKADDFRHWAHRDGFQTYATRREARGIAVKQGFIVVKRWYDAEVQLTKEEAKNSGY